jgi:hypothetical protein
MTSAARATRLSARPWAIAASVFIEHGATTMPAERNEPLAIVAPMSRALCTTSAKASISARRRSSSCWAVIRPELEMTRCDSTAPLARSAWSSRTP